MSEAENDVPQAAPQNLLRKIDAVCSEFERHWRAGHSPRIEQYADQIPREGRDAGLTELVALEIELRREAGESPDAVDYFSRFSGQEAIIRAAYGIANRLRADNLPQEEVPTVIGAPMPSETGDRQLKESPPVGLPKTVGRFQIVRLLGKGSFGIVYLATDPKLGNREVALKVPRPERFQSERDRQAFVRDAEYAARLNHVGIVTVHSVETDGDSVFIVQEYMSGGDLKHRLKSGGVSWDQAVAWMIPVAQAVAFAHQKDIFHRDLKPANILLNDRNEPRVADFGLALHESERLQHKHEFAGTVPYMSPEQVRREPHRLDGRSDTWSLGVIFYELLTGRRPFLGTDEELFEQIKYHDPRPPRELKPDLPPELERICLRCLARPVAMRYSSASDLAQDLRNWQQSVTTGMGVSTAVAVVQSTSPRVVPKGLRSFDMKDSEFFLTLLPGPRDRDGLPESVRFWKLRIEETDPAHTFKVGLLHGPSGCGKSSFVKAGLLPRLPLHVKSVFVEATAVDTEVRLLSGLRRALPDIPRDLSLPEIMGGLREGHWNPSGSKVLIVLDQFEQWLHAGNLSDPAQLVDALRHCDGEHLQCLLLVREDFWTGISRFMQRLEIPIQEEKNAGLVDRFDLLHAEKVLLEFGRAFGRLPEGAGELTSLQKAFLAAAVEQLSEDGRVICVRLALFADLIKGKPWTPDTLVQAGGAEGLGVTFLENTFAAKSAPEAHRRHEIAARKLFLKLLPEGISDIRGSMQSRQRLLEASGYAERPQHFDDLLRILTEQLRLITPTAPDGDYDDDGNTSLTADSDRRCYQLTHDYLVPSLRRWLNLKQSETARGRAEIRLAERSSEWNAQRETRHLPSLPEHLRIRLLTKREDWTEPQRRMMRAVRRRHLLWTVIWGSVLIVAAVTGAYARQSFRNAQQQTQAEGLVASLVNGKLDGILSRIPEIEPFRDRAVPMLQAAFDKAPDDSPEKLNASLSLLPVDERQVSYLATRLLSVEPQAFPIIREALRPHEMKLVDQMWDVWLDESNGPEKRFRAACALATFATLDDRWVRASGPVAALLVRQNSLVARYWIDALQPVRDILVPDLIRIYVDEQRDSAERSLAADVLSVYVEDDVDRLAFLTESATPEQFKIVFPALARHRTEAIAFLERQLTRPSLWNNPPLSQRWKFASQVEIDKLGKAHGILHERFACCAAMPLADFLQILKPLAECGYRPTRVRPWRQGTRVLVAAVWNRDGREFQILSDVTAEELRLQEARLQSENFVPVDVAASAGSDADGSDRYIGLWVQRTGSEQTAELALGVSNQFPTTELNSGNFGTGYSSVHQMISSSGELHFSCIRPFPRKNARCLVRQNYRDILRQVASGQFLLDLSSSAVPATNGLPETSPVRATVLPPQEKLRQAERILSDDSLDASTRFSAQMDRASALAALHDDKNAVTAWTELITANPDDAQYYLARAISWARLGEREAALKDVAVCVRPESGLPPSYQAYLDAVVSAWLKDPSGLERLTAALQNHLEDPEWLMNGACACALASEAFSETDPKIAERAAEQAMELLRGVAASGVYSSELRTDPDLESLRGRDDFRRLLNMPADKLSLAAVLTKTSELESVAEIGRTWAEHAAICQKMVEEGYRPSAVSVSEVTVDDLDARLPLVTSVWVRPARHVTVEEESARRRTNSAVALLRLGAPDLVWPLLKHSPNPQARTSLIHSLAPLNVDPLTILQRLERESDVSIRRALLLALGEFGFPAFPVAEREALLKSLQRWFLQDPDAGVHAAAEWLLRRWGREEIIYEGLTTLQVREHELLEKLKRDAQRWYVNSQRQTFVLFDAADVLMGSPNSEPGRTTNDYEFQHVHHISYRFAVASHEVTTAEFAEFLKDEPTALINNISGSPDLPDTPQSGVTWFAAAQYCNWLSRKEGISPDQWIYEPNADGAYAAGMKVRTGAAELIGYRLPIEAEWELACRAGALSSRYYGGSDTMLSKYAWFLNNSENHTMPVGLLKPNDAGLFDMLGNVLECCQDPFRNFNDATAGFTITNPNSTDPFSTSPVAADDRRAMRGGSCTYSLPNVRCAARHEFPAGELPPTHVGFRLARTIMD